MDRVIYFLEDGRAVYCDLSESSALVGQSDQLADGIEYGTAPGWSPVTDDDVTNFFASGQVLAFWASDQIDQAEQTGLPPDPAGGHTEYLAARRLHVKAGRPVNGGIDDRIADRILWAGALGLVLLFTIFFSGTG